MRCCCPVEAFREADTYLVIDPDECIDCGACVPSVPLMPSLQTLTFPTVKKRGSTETPKNPLTLKSPRAIPRPCRLSKPHDEEPTVLREAG